MIKKKYINRLVLGDTLDTLRKMEDNFVDLGITSPPYNKGEKHKGWLVKNVKYQKNSDDVPENVYQKQQIKVLDEIFRITKEGGSFFYNHKTRWDRGTMIHPMEWLLKTKWAIRQEIIWDRTIAANIRGWRFWQVDERIYWLYKPKNGNKIGTELKSKHALMTSIWRFPPEKNNDHPAPFPLVLPARIIISILNGKKGIVLDPYVGSGTTSLAAKLLECDYVGMDISKKYIQEAKKRLKKFKNEKQILEIELGKHFVKKTFKNRKELGYHIGKFGNGVEIKQKELLFNS